VKLQFLGATRQVTGSQYYLHAGDTRLLVDCGLFQEREFLERNWHPCPVRPRDLDAVLLTHAHIDHSGLVPKLVAEGFRGRVLATSASVDLVELVLRDSAQIQAEDAAFKRKRHRKEGRRGAFPEKPLYTERDVDRTLPLLEAVDYGHPIVLGDGVKATFHDAGHILGSAMIEFQVHENGAPRRLIFSGDLGQPGRPFARAPSRFTEADYLVLESTYGDRLHENHGNVERQLADVISQTVAAGGKVLIPIFAIERAQELLYHLGRLLRSGEIPRVCVYLDSPMAAAVTDIFRRHQDCFSPEIQEEIRAGRSPLAFPGLTTVRTVEQSKAINRLKEPAIIMATNGMCTAGRIKHHLAQYIDHAECTLAFVGYQAHGTLGRQLVDGAKEVRLHGRQRLVRARVAQVTGFSGHADRAALMAWLRNFTTPPRQLFVAHGEEQSAMALAHEVRMELDWSVTVPQYQQVADLP
jgi:metallo-beta-lactamase family protein